jgi:hypothetical protein
LQDYFLELYIWPKGKKPSLVGFMDIA